MWWAKDLQPNKYKVNHNLILSTSWCSAMQRQFTSTNIIVIYRTKWNLTQTGKQYDHLQQEIATNINHTRNGRNTVDTTCLASDCLPKELLEAQQVTRSERNSWIKSPYSPIPQTPLQTTQINETKESTCLTKEKRILVFLIPEQQKRNPLECKSLLPVNHFPNTGFCVPSTKWEWIQISKHKYSILRNPLTVSPIAEQDCKQTTELRQDVHGFYVPHHRTAMFFTHQVLWHPLIYLYPLARVQLVLPDHFHQPFAHHLLEAAARWLQVVLVSQLEVGSAPWLEEASALSLSACKACASNFLYS